MSVHEIRVPFAKNLLRTLHSLELCAGAGGLALGLARAGFKHEAVVEMDPASCDTLRFNKGQRLRHVRTWDISQADVGRFDFSEYEDLDLLSGGPPCQPFSQAGRRNGRSDKRDLFPQFISATRGSRPKSFIFENVKGLLHNRFIGYFNYIVFQLRFPDVIRKKGETWFEHRARLERLYTSGTHAGLKYNVIFQVLDSANFGVPQRRQRVFVVGVRADLGIEYSFPLPTHSRESLWREQWLTKEYWDRHRVPRKHRPTPPPALERRLQQLDHQANTLPWSTVRDAISDLPNVGIGRESHKIFNHFYNPGAREYDGHFGSQMDQPAKTLKAGRNGVPGGENMVRLDSGSVRYFSVRECARLQGFPDNWFFGGSWCSAMRQIGNAVPVPLAEAVAKPLANALLERASRSAPAS